MPMPHESLDASSIALHEQAHGKIGTSLKVPLEDMHDLALAYTPGVAAVSKLLAAHPERARDVSIKRSTVAIVTDGSAVLGLGNIGPMGALPVMEGKAALFKRFADIDAFPICLDTQDTEEIVRTVKLIAPAFGGINLEDIAAPRCFEIEARLCAELAIPVMHDDQHGTAVVVLAALINALSLRGMTAGEVRVVINGAGAAGIAITDLLLAHGVTDLVLCDSKGIVSAARTDLAGEKARLAAKTNPRTLVGTLADAMRGADIFIGVSKGGLVSEDMVRSMRAQPVIFAMANPEPEIMPERAKEAGAFIVATGRSDFPNQVNNVLVFPGVFRGALDAGVRDITEPMLLAAAANLSAMVTAPAPEKILPGPFEEGVAEAVAAAIRESAAA
ncbi:MAG TPA: NADP-dependent malic enzyme [Candidatus Paceibacterota bacterium]|nr:NADP-dependent malic enzyme [Candidatus Paceibacterota bacterium]